MPSLAGMQETWKTRWTRPYCIQQSSCYTTGTHVLVAHAPFVSAQIKLIASVHEAESNTQRHMLTRSTFSNCTCICSCNTRLEPISVWAISTSLQNQMENMPVSTEEQRDTQPGCHIFLNGHGWPSKLLDKNSLPKKAGILPVRIATL
jgi:hypothetical protein